MKLSVAIASENASANAFVVFRGIESSIVKASKLGYDGVELALKTPDEIGRKELSKLLKDNSLEISAVSTGQVFAARGLMFTDEDSERRTRLQREFEAFIDLAQDFGQLVNIGRVRGSLQGRSREKCEQLFLDLLGPVCDYAAARGVELLLEPVNRYEIDFINSLKEGVDFIKKSGISNLKLMPDVFHMNIEDASIPRAFLDSAPYVRYVHLADSNRHAPGDGHMNFEQVFEALRTMGYDDWCTVEILPFPDPDTAASRAERYLRTNFIPKQK